MKPITRPIKFRAWDSITKAMLPMEIIDAIPFFITPHGERVPFFENHVVPQQFTGLLDKNGKEIYEGDIARHRKAGDFDSSTLITGEVIIEPTRGVVIGGWPAAFDIEVIGNIYENPELLGGAFEKAVIENGLDRAEVRRQVISEERVSPKGPKTCWGLEE